jgi:hypothetical protein
MSGGHHLFDSLAFPRPTSAPFLHFTDALRALRAHQRGEFFVAETASSFECIVEMERYRIRLFFRQSGCHSHLRHDGCTAPANLALIHQQHVRAGPGSSDGRIHARSSSPND